MAATLAGLGLAAGVGGAAGGLATAYTGFSTLVAAVSMGPMLLQMVWLIATGVVMWRHTPARRLPSSRAV